MTRFQQFFPCFHGQELEYRCQSGHAFPPFSSANSPQQPVGRSCLIAVLVLIGVCVLPKTSYAGGLEGLGIMVDAGYSRDNNLTNASDQDDKRVDNALSLDLSGNKAFALSEHTRLALSGFIEAKAFATYSGLDRLSADVEAEYMYRPSAEFEAPTFGFVTNVGRDEFKSDLRKNNHYSAGITLRKPVTDRINVFAALKDNISRSDNDVFTTRHTSTQLNVDYGFGNGNTLYLTTEYRVGDIVSTSGPDLKYRDVSAAWINDDVFVAGQPMRDYRLKGKTTLIRLGGNVPLEGKKSLDISWRYARSTSDLAPDYDAPAIKYTGSQFSIDYLMGF